MATKNESAEIGTVKPKCNARVVSPGGYWGHACGKTATYEESGTFYCKTHHPPTVEAKRDAKHAKWNAEFDARMAKVKAVDDEFASLRKSVRSGEGEWIGHKELAAMRKDAARYLKWRDLHLSCLNGGYGLDLLIAIAHAKQHTDVDATIDAEIAKSGA